MDTTVFTINFPLSADCDKVKGAPRPRASSRGGFASVYNPKWYTNYQKAIKEAYSASHGVLRHGAVSVTIDVFRVMPKSRPKKLEKELDTFKPDADNIAKGILDALNGVAYDDDAQIVDLHIVKHPRERREADKIVVTLKED